MSEWTGLVLPLNETARNDLTISFLAVLTSDRKLWPQSLEEAFDRQISLTSIINKREDSAASWDLRQLLCDR